MKKITSWIIVFVSAFLFSKAVLAAEKSEVNGNILVQSELINPSGGESFLNNDINFYITQGGKFGAGVNMNFVSENDYVKVKPFATWQLGESVNLVGGFSSDSAGADHLHGGLWYCGKLSEKITLFTDARAYWGINDEARDFFDFFADTRYAINKKWSVGSEAVFDFWLDNGDEFILIGPTLHYKIHESFEIFSRVAYESDFGDHKAFDIRVTFNFLF